MSREQRRTTTLISFNVLHKPETTAGLRQLKSVFSSCHGPCGGYVTVSSDTRGNGIVTSQCSRILSTVRINQPINRVVATLVTSHLKQYHDQGLFSAIFGINLVLCALDMGSSFRSVTDVFKCISSEIVLFLKEYALSERGTETELQALLSLSRSMMDSLM